MFNSLTLVGYTALEEDAPHTEEIAYTLSELLRYSLRNTATKVALSEEVEMVERYLAIQQMHFGERLHSLVPGSIRTSMTCSCRVCSSSRWWKTQSSMGLSW